MHNKLAAIFKYVELEKKYICDSIAIASIDDNNNYRIEVGKYTGYDNNILKKIVDNESLNCVNELSNNEIEIINDNKRLAVFLFDNKMLSELGEKLEDYTRISAIRFIRERLQKTELINICNNIYGMRVNTKNIVDLPLSDVFSVKNFWQDDKEEFVKKIETFDNKKIEKIVNTDILDKVVNISAPAKIIEKEGIDFSALKFIPADSIENDELFKKIDEIEKYSNNIDPVEIINSISKNIIGQEDAIKTLVSNIYFNQKLIDSLDKSKYNEISRRKVSILLEGPTGTGKSEILKSIQEKFSLPLKVVDSSQFTEAGYVGRSITDILKDLINEANGNIELAERGIIVLDEIDKIACNPSGTGKDSKKPVQEELLGLLSGGKYVIEIGKTPLTSKSVEIDTSKITFILSGAFTSLREKKIKDNSSNSIGFNNKEENKDNTYTIDIEDYIEYGFLREFIGRVKVFTYTKGYTKEDLKRILLESEISPLKDFNKNFTQTDINKKEIKKVVFDDEFIDRLCEEAYNMNTGARALQNVVDGIQNIFIQDVVTGDFEGDEILIDSSLLDSYTKKKVRRY